MRETSRYTRIISSNIKKMWFSLTFHNFKKLMKILRWKFKNPFISTSRFWILRDKISNKNYGVHKKQFIHKIRKIYFSSLWKKTRKIYKIRLNYYMASASTISVVFLAMRHNLIPLISTICSTIVCFELDSLQRWFNREVRNITFYYELLLVKFLL